ncbi:MAG TPA: peptide ABC transporter substrate-binding protein [Anaerolineae bacterium]|nr:peptide ABC transporter substrate-binding protein [Anaerolineae bacterium]
MIRHYLLFGVLCLFVLTSCTNNATNEPAVNNDDLVAPTTEFRSFQQRDTLRIVFGQVPGSLNPHLSGGVAELEASRIAYEPLASFNQAGDLIPYLAAEIPSLDNGGVDPDGRWVIWNLRQDVKWADGAPFTAYDVLFTYEYVTNPAIASSSASTYAGITSIELLDEYSIKITFDKVTPFWQKPFVGNRGLILPRHLFEAYNNANFAAAPYNNIPIGTGAYYALSNNPQEVIFLGENLIQTNKVVYEPNPYYYDPDFFDENGDPPFDQLVLEGGRTAAEAAHEVLRATDDAAEKSDFARNLTLSTDALNELVAEGNGSLLITRGSRLEMLIINRTDPNTPSSTGERSSIDVPHPFFDDIRVRQAIRYGIDRDRIAALYGATGEAVSNYLLVPENFSSPNTSYEFDLDKAAALLDEAGWTDTNGDGIRDNGDMSLTIEYLTIIDPIIQETQAIIKEDLAKIGVEVILAPVEIGVFYRLSDPQDGSVLLFYADIQQPNFSSPSPDPTTYMSFWTCNQIPQQANDWGAGFNIGRWCNEEYDQLYQQVLTEINPERRRDLFIQMNDIQINDVAMIPLVRRSEVSAVRRTVTGYEPNPWDGALWNIKDWRRVTNDNQ